MEDHDNDEYALEFSEEYKLMMDKMLKEEEAEELRYLSKEYIENKFQR